LELDGYCPRRPGFNVHGFAGAKPIGNEGRLLEGRVIEHPYGLIICIDQHNCVH
jgi:hypothetical protein